MLQLQKQADAQGPYKVQIANQIVTWKYSCADGLTSIGGILTSHKQVMSKSDW